MLRLLNCCVVSVCLSASTAQIVASWKLAFNVSSPMDEKKRGDALAEAEGQKERVK